jgi:hypothetical protein
MLDLATKHFNFSGLSSISRLTKDRLYKQRVIFAHVPKSAGTSLSHSLRLRFIFSQFRLLEEESRLAVEGMSPDGWMRFKRQLVAYQAELGTHFIQAHFPVDSAFLDKYVGRYAFVTILRDPVQRVLSAYYFDPRLRQRDPEEFLESPRGFTATHVLCHFFGGLHWDTPQDPEGAALKAVANLQRFAAVGVLENLEGFYEQLRTRLGIRLSIPKRNIGMHRHTEELPPRIIDRIRSMCHQDMRIYRHFCPSSEAESEDRSLAAGGSELRLNLQREETPFA